MFTFFVGLFADQPCQECHEMFPLGELVPIVAPNGNLIGWRCFAHADWTQASA